MKKRILAVMVAAALLFSGCSPKQESPKGTDGNLEEVNIVLDWYPNAVHGFIYEAIDKGYYEEEGLKVNVQFPANANDPLSLTAAGKADFGIYYMHDLISTKINQDVPVKSIGAICQAPLNVIISLKESGINGPLDLVGKKVGLSGSDVHQATVKNIVANAGGDPESVEFIDVGFELMSALTTKRVDATIGNMVNHEVPQMEEQGFDINYFYPYEYGSPYVYELVLLAGDKVLNDNPEKVQKFIRASKKGFAEMKKDPEETLNLLISNQNKENFPLNENVEKKSLEILMPIMQPEGKEFLDQDKAVWEENVKWLYENKVIDKEIDASELLVDTSNN